MEFMWQVDYSENAALVHQNEIQFAHWAHKQATLFTSYAWVDKDLVKVLMIFTTQNRVSMP